MRELLNNSVKQQWHLTGLLGLKGAPVQAGLGVNLLCSLAQAVTRGDAELCRERYC